MDKQKSDTQEREQNYFNKFRQLYLLPEGVVVYGDKPDVTIESSKTIGIEITNFYLRSGKDLSSEQQQSDLRKKIISEAHRLYLKNGGKNIELSFGFNLIKDKKGIAQKIADFASKIEHKESGEILRAAFKHIPEVASIYLNSIEYEKPKWHLMQVYSPPLIQTERLEEIIRKKETIKYRPCDSYWLLIVIDFMNPAQDQEIASPILPTIQSNKFDKIIIYKTAYEQILEVPTS